MVLGHVYSQAHSSGQPYECSVSSAQEKYHYTYACAKERFKGGHDQFGRFII